LPNLKGEDESGRATHNFSFFSYALVGKTTAKWVRLPFGWKVFGKISDFSEIFNFRIFFYSKNDEKRKNSPVFSEIAGFRRNFRQKYNENIRFLLKC